MKSTLNRISIMGRMVRDPELRHTQSSIPVCSFSVACDRDYKVNGEKVTDFIDIVAWRGTAELASKYLTRGRMVVIDGRIQLRDWTDRDGNKRRSAEILASSISFADSRSKKQEPSPPPLAVAMGRRICRRAAICRSDLPDTDTAGRGTALPGCFFMTIL